MMCRRSLLPQTSPCAVHTVPVAWIWSLPFNPSTTLLPHRTTTLAPSLATRFPIPPSWRRLLSVCISQIPTNPSMSLHSQTRWRITYRLRPFPRLSFALFLLPPRSGHSGPSIPPRRRRHLGVSKVTRRDPTRTTPLPPMTPPMPMSKR